MVMAAMLLIVGSVGCGGSKSDSSPPTTSAATRPDPATTRFLTLGNQVCATVRHGAPSPLRRSVNPVELAKHARAARGPTHRTIVSLGRLPVPPARRAALNALIRAERDLQAEYLAIVRDPSATESRAKTLNEREQLASSRAMSLGLPGCGARQQP